MGTKTWMGEITAPNNQHTQYVKPTLDIDEYKPIIQGLMWHTSIHGEYASKNQYANEQLQIGGPYTVRGYLKQTMLGNAGIYMRNDLAWILPTQAMKCDGYQFFCEALPYSRH
ncbi:ShlB/FhaC/HecB family hemolysin secretion/activation protein [Commensalibacter papalotli (ex Servin-Garciduenas et al. 2014)]|uniref:Hemolysin activator protein n=1 Tax=Commensalibacter papalotli (ex Servin-Garciduenas et al. 2014) TaxID=1208583 RepID=W7E8F9_9PROT|nr:ShlB/FhaC/HecB family hemolysin secretion/activation protein [Commensalibacter papalotli (ex Servin-Garciduenas et al. 2014)]EUK19426.1 hemolysin activator protein [Commensalibacter papalotli (ex Servin-Garciduenas et al. 2014)]